MDNPKKYEIDYWYPNELPNKTLMFQIHDENEKVVGYAVTSSANSFNLLGSDLNFLSESDYFKALKTDLRRFCEVYYHEHSDKKTES